MTPRQSLINNPLPTAIMAFCLTFSLFMAAPCWSQQPVSSTDIYSGFYSRAENYGEVARSSGHSHFIKFYPQNRITRLYIPFPYSKSLSPETIDAVMDIASAKSKKSAYLKDKFELLDERSVAHLDFVREVDGQTMFDCGKATPCKISFDPDAMTITTPGVVMELEIRWQKINPGSGD